MISSLARLHRVVGVGFTVAALVFGLAPRIELYRCLMMGTVVDAPCCAVATHPSGETHSRIDASCLEHLPGGPSALRAVRGAPEARPAAAPRVTAIAFAPLRSPPLAVADSLDSRDARGSPPERRLRVPTTVLRV